MNAPELASWESAGNRHISLTRDPVRPHHRAIAALAQRHMPPDAKVLDFGCGLGRISELIAAGVPGAAITLADPYQQCLDVARGRVPGAAVSLLDERAPDIAGLGLGSYDVVIASHVLEHTMAPADTAGQLLDLLTPNGVAILAVPNAGRPKVVLHGLRRRRYSNRGHVVAWDMSHWLNFLDTIVGAEIVETAGDEVQLLPPQLVNRVALAQRAQERLARPLMWWSFSLIAVVRRPKDGGVTDTLRDRHPDRSAST